MKDRTWVIRALKDEAKKVKAGDVITLGQLDRFNLERLSEDEWVGLGYTKEVTMYIRNAMNNDDFDVLGITVCGRSIKIDIDVQNVLNEPDGLA